MARFSMKGAAERLAGKLVDAARVYHSRALVADVNGDYESRREECEWRDDVMYQAERVGKRFGIVIPDVSREV